MGLAVVPGQDFAGFPGPVCEGALAYLAAGDREMGDCHGESPGRWLAHHLLCCQSSGAVGTRCLVLAAMFTACGIPDLHCMGPSAAVAAPTVAGDGVRPVGCPCPGPPGTVPPASAFRARHPGSSHSHRAARCAPSGGCTSLGERRERLKAGPATVHYAPRRAKRHAVAHCRARGEQGPRTAGR